MDPPAWVLDDLVTFAQDGHQTELQAALLLHTARQDNLLYDIIQQVVVPRWFAGERELIRADIQRFLDDVRLFTQKLQDGVTLQEKSYPAMHSLPYVTLACFRE